MPRYSIDAGESIGTVNQNEYEKEREGRLKGQELAESSKYKLRHIATPRSPAHFAVDFLCEVKKVEQSDEFPGYNLDLDLINKDGRVIKIPLDMILPLSPEGLILIRQENGELVSQSEQGYILSAFDEMDLELAELSKSTSPEEAETIEEQSQALV